MKDQNTQPTHKDLVAQLQERGWDLVTGNPAFSKNNRTLEELVRTTHERHQKGEAPGIIKKIETAIELDLIQLQKLWEYMGLPL